MDKKYLSIGFSALMAFAVMSCSEDSFVPDPNDPFAQSGDRAETFEFPLNLITDMPQSIGKPHVNDIASRAGETTDGDNENYDDPSQATEEALKDIWVFQFDENGNQLIAPRFYEVTSTAIRDLNIRLAEGTKSQVYVLANTCDPEWAVGKDLTTVEKFVDYKYPFEEENVEMGKDKYLLMEGHVQKDIYKEADLEPVDIHMTRMMAKISFKYKTIGEAQNLVVTRVIINNMPLDMRMEETPIDQEYPVGNDFETRSVTLNKNLQPGETYTFYMPANRRGTTANTDPGTKNNGAPAKALYVQLFISSKSNGSSFLYTIYPGANDTNDFNVRRNYNYNITLNLNSEGRDDRVLAAPANCYVLTTNDEIMFDPYTRTETAGDWKYSDYVNKNDPDKTIVRAAIVWQQPNVIGNNTPASGETQGKLVYLDKYDRIHVKSGSANGNAVIAGYNAKNEIVWSWHIWVNDGKPAELAAAVPYYTFDWNETNGILASQGRTRKGRSLMKCNLGAIDANRNEKCPSKTFGCMYQWGRKDPFPGPWGITKAGSSYVDGTEGAEFDYTDAVLGQINDNANAKVTFSTNRTADQLFNVKSTSATVGTVEYSLKHPTQFISPFASPAKGSPSSTAYIAGTDGDWFWGHNDKLWGGSSFAGAKQYLVTVRTGGTAYLSDNGATEKSLFDPCPAGWMVPPADVWLSFTKDGNNWNDGSDSSYPNMNTADNKTTNEAARGYRMYMSQEWKKGDLVFFPSAGYIPPNGSMWRAGFCGNYHTTTGNVNGRTNAFHMHTPSFMYPFETGTVTTRRATGATIRCVRDVDD